MDAEAAEHVGRGGSLALLHELSKISRNATFSKWPIDIFIAFRLDSLSTRAFFLLILYRGLVPYLNTEFTRCRLGE